MKGIHHLSNVHVNSVLNGKEEYVKLQENLKQAAAHMEEMQEQGIEIRGQRYKVSWYICADYKWMSIVLGHKAATINYCIWCLVDKNKWRETREKVTVVSFRFLIFYGKLLIWPRKILRKFGEARPASAKTDVNFSTEHNGPLQPNEARPCLVASGEREHGPAQRLVTVTGRIASIPFELASS